MPHQAARLRHQGLLQVHSGGAEVTQRGPVQGGGRGEQAAGNTRWIACRGTALSSDRTAQGVFCRGASDCFVHVLDAVFVQPWLTVVLQ